MPPPPPSGYGLSTLVALVVTGMIGSGVFTTSGYALESLGAADLVLAAWAAAGIVALCGAVAYGALAVRMPQSGGEYLYLSRAVHPFAGFLAGLISIIAGFVGSTALAALACEQYAAPLLPPQAHLPRATIATAVVLLCGIGHALAGRLAVRLTTAIVAVKMLAIGGLIVAGRSLLGGRPLPEPAAAAAVPPAAFAATVMWIMYSYIGFNEAIYVAAEAHRPRRTVPCALLLGTLVTTITYLLLNDVILRAAPVATLSGQPDVAAIAAAAIGGPVFEGWMRGAIALSTFAAVAGMMMAGPRVTSSMADDGLLPRSFAGNAGIGRAALLQTLLAGGLVQQTTILGLLNYLGVTLSLCSACTVATLWLPGPAREPRHRRPPARGLVTRVGVQLAAGLYVAATLLFVGVLAVDEPRHLLGTVLTLIAAAAVWPFTGGSRRTADAPLKGGGHQQWRS
jgi:amino acid transporter